MYKPWKPQEPRKPSTTKSKDIVVESMSDRAQYWEGRVDEDDEDEMERLGVRAKRIKFTDVKAPQGFTLDDLYITACYQDDYLCVEVRCTNDVPKTRLELLNDKEKYDEAMVEYNQAQQEYVKKMEWYTERLLEQKKKEKEKLENEIANMEAT